MIPVSKGMEPGTRNNHLKCSQMQYTVAFYPQISLGDFSALFFMCLRYVGVCAIMIPVSKRMEPEGWKLINYDFRCGNLSLIRDIVPFGTALSINTVFLCLGRHFSRCIFSEHVASGSAIYCSWNVLVS